jgi:predicted Zn-dependent protease
LAWLAAGPAGAWAAPASAPILRALDRMYNFDFPGANQILDDRIREEPHDPLGYTFRAASLLFQELDRLQILEGEFFSDDKRIIEKKKLKADEDVRRQFYEFIEMARRRAQHRLTSEPKHVDSLFAMCITAGLVTDYVGLIERRQLGSLEHAKQSHSYAVKLLKEDPTFTDAYLTTGLTEYLLGSVPFFVRWFIKFEDASGDKARAETNLQKVVSTGRYLGPFAKILLCIIYLREKRPSDCERLLRELSRDFPENRLIRKELAKVSMISRQENQ